MGIKRSLITTDMHTPLSTAVRVNKYLLGGSPLADGIMVCKINEKIEHEVAYSIDFEVHKHIEL